MKCELTFFLRCSGNSNNNWRHSNTAYNEEIILAISQSRSFIRIWNRVGLTWRFPRKLNPLSKGTWWSTDFLHARPNWWMGNMWVVPSYWHIQFDLPFDCINGRALSKAWWLFKPLCWVIWRDFPSPSVLSQMTGEMGAYQLVQWLCVPVQWVYLLMWSIIVLTSSIGLACPQLI